MLMDPFLKVNKLFSYVQQQEPQKQYISHNSRLDSIALISQKGYSPPKNFAGSRFTSRTTRDRPYCTHCKITEQTFETCFKGNNAEALVCRHCDMSGHTIEKFSAYMGTLQAINCITN